MSRCFEQSCASPATSGGYCTTHQWLRPGADLLAEAEGGNPRAESGHYSAREEITRLTLLEKAEQLTKRPQRAKPDVVDPERDAVFVAYLRGEITSAAAGTVLGITNHAYIGQYAAHVLRRLIHTGEYEIRRAGSARVTEIGADRHDLLPVTRRRGGL